MTHENALGCAEEKTGMWPRPARRRSSAVPSTPEIVGLVIRVSHSYLRLVQAKSASLLCGSEWSNSRLWWILG
jgi:hypothetical protein